MVLKNLVSGNYNCTSVVSILFNINGFHKFTCCDILPIAVLEI